MRYYIVHVYVLIKNRERNTHINFSFKCPHYHFQKFYVVMVDIWKIVLLYIVSHTLFIQSKSQILSLSLDICKRVSIYLIFTHTYTQVCMYSMWANIHTCFTLCMDTVVMHYIWHQIKWLKLSWCVLIKMIQRYSPSTGWHCQSSGCHIWGRKSRLLTPQGNYLGVGWGEWVDIRQMKTYFVLSRHFIFMTPQFYNLKICA